ncbi:thiol:disulfide interchange protein DsbA [Providencia alcalifaciens]|nr:thiol:disulfide interchange protein DsbA [Providencia alcalifaciens]
MKLKLKHIAIFSMLLSISAAQAASEKSAYVTLNSPVAEAPSVVEFFSFYCGPCYLFNHNYNVDKAVSKALPKDIKLTKYHVGAMGKLGNELTEAWSIAMVLDVEDKMEPLLFDAQMNKKINNSDDIKVIFKSIGISSDVYDEMKGSKKVKDLTFKQNEAVKSFNVTSTPSFYVSGKYKIENQNVPHTNIEDYTSNYADLINKLLMKG